MWWECTQCPSGGNSPQAKDEHTKETGHFVKVVYDARIEED
ncbi:hypothetical protein SEA_HAGER_71 [Microbacterium phage Hager]|nr:hypothetical protein SEA_HAGER_71 [Microbacterium phage Hager]